MDSRSSVGSSNGQIIELFMRFCSDANLDIKQVGDCLGKYILAYQRNISHKVAFDVLYATGRNAKAYINWDYVEKQLAKVETPIHWITLLKYMDFSTVPRQNQRMLVELEQHLNTIGIPNPSAICCLVFFLKNLNFISAKKGVTRLFAEHQIQNPDEKAMELLSLVADSAFDMNETTAVFCHIISKATVRLAELEEQVQFLNLRNEELVENFRLKNQLRATSTRPRLRSKLKQLRKSDVNSVMDMDTFASWCQNIRFPTVFALHTKHKLYFLMSQIPEHVASPHEHVLTITNDSYVFEALRNALVQKPDHDVLYTVISGMRLQDEPFKELQDFRCECMNAFPVSQLNGMRLNDLLHLYVCAYQSPRVWKEIWKLLIPLLSHQVIRDVEAFTCRRPFNFIAILNILNQ
jgi:hypothetical protein